MAVDKTEALLKVVERIPPFAGLGRDGARLILSLCEVRAVNAGETLCRVGEQSDEMFVLLSGQLEVLNEEHVKLATIAPGSPVGEMGLITGQPRSATVQVSARANVLVLRKLGFDRLLRSNGQVCARVFRNVLHTMARRLEESRQTQRRLHDECDELVESLRALDDGRRIGGR